MIDRVSHKNNNYAKPPPSYRKVSISNKERNPKTVSKENLDEQVEILNSPISLTACIQTKLDASIEEEAETKFLLEIGSIEEEGNLLLNNQR